MRAAGRGPGASGKCTRVLGKVIRQLFPGTTESLVSVEGRPPLGAVIPGPSFLSVSTPGADLATVPYLSRPTRPSLCLEVPFPMTSPGRLLFISPHCLWEVRFPKLGQLLCSHRPVCHFCTTRCPGFSHCFTSVAPLDHAFHETWELASPLLTLWACKGPS